MPTETFTPTSVGDITALARSWARDLRAANLSPRTIQSYMEAVRLFTEYLVEAGMPTDVTGITREHVGAFIEDQLARRSASTAGVRYSSLRVFFNWLVEEGEIKDSPMRRMRKPKVPSRIIDMPSDDDLKRLLRSMSGNAFDDLRDTAIIRVFMSTGARLAEVGGITLDDLALDGGRPSVRVIGKGDRQRDSHLDPKAVKALDRYLRRARSQHPDARSRWLWLGKKGRYTASGISQMIRDRGAALGVKLHPHAFRHWRASEYKAAGLSDGIVMALLGWEDPGMVRRYGKQNEASVALDAAARLDHRRDL